MGPPGGIAAEYGVEARGDNINSQFPVLRFIPADAGPFTFLKLDPLGDEATESTIANLNLYVDASAGHTSIGSTHGLMNCRLENLRIWGQKNGGSRGIAISWAKEVVHSHNRFRNIHVHDCEVGLEFKTMTPDVPGLRQSILESIHVWHAKRGITLKTCQLNTLIDLGITLPEKYDPGLAQEQWGLLISGSLNRVISVYLEGDGFPRSPWVFLEKGNEVVNFRRINVHGGWEVHHDPVQMIEKKPDELAWQVVTPEYDVAYLSGHGTLDGGEGQGGLQAQPNLITNGYFQHGNKASRNDGKHFDAYTLVVRDGNDELLQYNPLRNPLWNYVAVYKPLIPNRSQRGEDFLLPEYVMSYERSLLMWLWKGNNGDNEKGRFYGIRQELEDYHPLTIRWTPSFRQNWG